MNELQSTRLSITRTHVRICPKHGDERRTWILKTALPYGFFCGVKSSVGRITVSSARVTAEIRAFPPLSRHVTAAVPSAVVVALIRNFSSLSFHCTLALPSSCVDASIRILESLSNHTMLAPSTNTDAMIRNFPSLSTTCQPLQVIELHVIVSKVASRGATTITANEMITTANTQLIMV